MFGAMAFTFGGFNLLHFVHPNVVAIVAHLPWLLVAIDVLVRGNNPRVKRLAFAAIALLTGSQMLLGSPQFILFSLMLEAGYVLWISKCDRISWRAVAPDLLRWAAAILIGCLIGGVQLLPTFDALSHSVRHSAGGDFATQGSLHPLNLIQLVAPYLFDKARRRTKHARAGPIYWRRAAGTGGMVAHQRPKQNSPSADNIRRRHGRAGAALGAWIIRTIGLAGSKCAAGKSIPISLPRNRVVSVGGSRAGRIGFCHADAADCFPRSFQQALVDTGC